VHYREVVLEDDKTLADSGTETFDLNIRDPITELILKYRVKNAGAVAADVPPEKTISKIEIVDGGQTYLSMTGYEAVAVACYDKGFWPPHWYAEVASSNQRISIPLQFGRFVGDREFGFDPTKLNNPQLKFTWAKDTLHATGEVSLGIIAKVMEGVGSPGRCLLTKAVESWTGGASGVKKVDLWSDYPYRRIFARSYLYGSTLANLYSHLKLSCDADKLVIFDCDSAEFQDILRTFFRPFQVRKMDSFETGAIDYKNCHVDGRTTCQGSVGTQYLNSMFWASGANYYSMRVVDAAGAETACNVQVLITGEFPHATYCYQFGLADDPDSWFNAPSYKDIDLNLTEGGAAANSVLVQQPRSLP